MIKKEKHIKKEKNRIATVDAIQWNNGLLNFCRGKNNQEQRRWRVATERSARSSTECPGIAEICFRSNVTTKAEWKRVREAGGTAGEVEKDSLEEKFSCSHADQTRRRQRRAERKLQG